METKLSKHIYELRKDSKLTQQALAKLVGVSQKAIDFWEKGINEPKASYVIKLATIFNVTADYLLGLKDDWF